MRQLLLLSSSATLGTAFLEYALTPITELFGGRSLVFVPYALRDHAGCTARIRVPP
jgi:peptidase E